MAADLLEVLRQHDYSWHPCRVSLSPYIAGGSSLIVEFENCNIKDVISTREEALARLRIRSIPLPEDGCLHIKEGDYILALCSTPIGNLFFDAVVEKIWRIKHSSSNQCKCTFGVRWLFPEINVKTRTVSSRSVRKLAGNSIQSHPTVSAFLNSMNTLSDSGITSSVSLLEEVEEKIDFQRLLEDQIEEISKVADASSKAVSEETLLEVKKKETLYNCTNHWRTTRSQRKLQPETVCKNSSLIQPSPGEHFLKQACLSPLAARAALASLMNVDKEGCMDTSQISKHMNVVSLDLSHTFMNLDICIQEKQSSASNHSSERSILITSDPVKLVNDTFKKPMPVSSSFISSHVDSFEKSQMMENSHEAVAVEETMPGSLNSRTVTTRFTRSLLNKMSDDTKLKAPSKDENLNRATLTKRFTRSAIQKEMEHSADEVEMASSVKDRRLISHTTVRRVSHSLVQKEMDKSINEELTTEDGWLSGPAITNSSNLSVQNDMANSVCDGVLESTKATKLSGLNTRARLTCSARREEFEVSVEEVGLKSSTKDGGFSCPAEEVENSVNDIKHESSGEDERKGNSSSVRRLTRSANQRETRNSEMQNSLNDVEHKSSGEDERKDNSASARRLTRSANQKGNSEMENPVNDVKHESSGEDERKDSSSSARRLTRSANKREMGNSVNDVKHKSLSEDERIDSSACARRLTRSANQRGMVSSVNDVKHKSSGNDERIDNSASARRLTRSANQQEMRNSGNDVKHNSSGEDDRKDNSASASVLTSSANLREMGSLEMKISVNDVEHRSLVEDGRKDNLATARRSTRFANQTEMGNSLNDVKYKSSGTDERKDNFVSISRLTRSANQREMGNSEKENSVNDAKHKSLGKNNSATARRLAHSANQSEMGISEDVIKIDFTSPKTTSRVTHPSLQRGMLSSVTGDKIESAARDGGFNGSPTMRELTRLERQKGMENSVGEVKIDSLDRGGKVGSRAVSRPKFSFVQKETGYSAEVDPDASLEDWNSKNSPISSRLTRSTYLKQLDNSTAKGQKNWKRDECIQESRIDDTLAITTPMSKKRTVSSSDTETGPSQGKRKEEKSTVSKLCRIQGELENSTLEVKEKQSQNLVSDDNGGVEKKRSLSCCDAEGNISEGKRKMRRVSSTLAICGIAESGKEEKNRGAEGGDFAQLERQKLKKPQLRFSRRLNFLPRTRSQTKLS